MKEMRLGVIGAGWISIERHLPILKMLSRKYGMRVQSISDINVQRAESAARKFKIPSYYEDYIDMIEKEDLDIVDICTPIKTHSKIALDAMERGLHILVEKPLSHSSMDARKMITIASNKNVKLMVLHTRRFYPAVEKAKMLLEKGVIGRPMIARLSVLYSDKEPQLRQWKTWMIWEYGSHQVFNTIFYLGEPHKFHVNILKSNFPPCFQIVLFCEKGIGIVDFFCTDTGLYYEEILGNEGLLSVAPHGYFVTIKKDEGVLSELSYNMKSILNLGSLAVRYIRNGIRLSPHYILLDRGLNAIINNAPLPVKPEDALKVVEILEGTEKIVQNAMSP